MNCYKSLRIALVLAATFSFAKAVSAIQTPTLDRDRAATIKRIGDEVKMMASDEWEGRGVNTKGIEKAADYIKKQFKEFGVKSGVEDGSYYQPFDITLRDMIDDKNASCAIIDPKGKKTKLVKGKDFQPQNAGGDGDVSGDLVFVGYGIEAEDLGYQEYKDVDVTGKVVIVLRREPQQDDSDSEFNGKNPSEHAYIRAKLKVAKEQGAAGILFVNDSVSSNAGQSDRLAFPHQFARTADPLPMAFVKRSVIDGLLANTPLKSGDRTFKSLKEFEDDVDKSLKPASQVLAGHRATYKASFSVPTVTTNNVVGVIEGEGPLAEETIVIGGHYDHLGYGFYGSLAPKRGGEVHNGADDNATGTIAVVELARRFALAKTKPKRRLVFIAFSGEERGLLGSYYYCRNQPLFPLEKTIAMINYDMIGQMKNNNLTIFGGTSGDGLADLLREVGKDTELKLNLVPGGFAGSDHLPFNAKKIPNMFLHTGTGSGLYHTPDDDFETINVEGMADVIDYSEDLINQLAGLEKRLEYKSASRVNRNRVGYLGVQTDADAESEGAFIAKVMKDSPADKAGFKIGDLVKKIDQKEVEDAASLVNALRRKRPGQKVKITIERDAKEMTIEVALGTPPARE
ncbi:MAG: M20/M25/M40 family metallo-hydrolase [Planctomycetota bacterium]|nr:M20/M25/M40 family metallo-hydrolase [Planctomycetota bacterium]